MKILAIGTVSIVALCALLFLALWFGLQEDAKRYAPEHSTAGVQMIVPFVLVAVALPLFWIGVIVAWAFSTTRKGSAELDTNEPPPGVIT